MTPSLPRATQIGSQQVVEHIWIWFSDNGNIRKWDSKPFPEGTEYVAALSRTAQAPVDVRKRAQRLSNVAKDFAARFTINDLAEDDDRQRQAVIEQARLLDSALASSDPTPAAEAGGDEVAAQRLAASPLPSSSGTGWRPIETAPKDGTNVLGAHDRAAIVVYWQHEWTVDGAPGWATGETDLGGYFYTFPVTHWRVLPPLPSAPVSDGGEHGE